MRREQLAHVLRATSRIIGDSDLLVIGTYDERMIEAAQLLGLRTVTPR